MTGSNVEHCGRIKFIESSRRSVAGFANEACNLYRGKVIRKDIYPYFYGAARGEKMDLRCPSDKSAEVVTALLDKAFTDRRSGIPGNDDSGAMSSWFIFNSLGFYPNAGQDVYLIGTPSFPEVEIKQIGRA